jgi:hypothetical protein
LRHSRLVQHFAIVLFRYYVFVGVAAPMRKLKTWKLADERLQLDAVGSSDRIQIIRICDGASFHSGSRNTVYGYV